MAVFPLYKQDDCIDPSWPVLGVCILVFWMLYFFEFYISCRQFKRYSDTEIPKKLRDILAVMEMPKKKAKKEETGENTDTGNDLATDKPKGKGGDVGEEDDEGEEEAPKSYLHQTLDKFKKSQIYNKDKSAFAFLTTHMSAVEQTAKWVFGYFPFMWDVCQQLMEKSVPASYQGPIAHACVFLMVTCIIDTVSALPISLYKSFVIEERHGFNKMTFRTFVTDTIKSLLLTLAFGVPILAMMLKVIEWGGEQFYFYLWAFTSVLSVVLMTVIPVYIMPCFNKFEELPVGPLRQAIEDLAAQLNFPLKKLLKVDGSKRSNHSNAYFTGLCTSKRIVLFDTLIDQAEQPEIVAIIGHEMGHWSMGHLFRGLFITQIQLFTYFIGLSYFMASDELIGGFGMADHSAFVVMMFFFNVVLMPLSPCIQFLMSAMSRHHEFQADRFAAELGFAKELQIGLVKIQLENLGSMAVDPLYSAYHHSHPPLVERLDALTALEDAAKKYQ